MKNNRKDEIKKKINALIDEFMSELTKKNNHITSLKKQVKDLQRINNKINLKCIK